MGEDKGKKREDGRSREVSGRRIRGEEEVEANGGGGVVFPGTFSRSSALICRWSCSQLWPLNIFRQ